MCKANCQTKEEWLLFSIDRRLAIRFEMCKNKQKKQKLSFIIECVLHLEFNTCKKALHIKGAWVSEGILF